MSDTMNDAELVQFVREEAALLRRYGFSNRGDLLDLAVARIEATAGVVEACEECLAIVRLQNGNLYPDTNAVQERARAAIAKYKGASNE